MARLKVYHDKEGRTLTVWLADPATEHVCDEVADDLILMKNRQGQVIGFEQLNYRTEPQNGEPATLQVESQTD